MACQVLDDDGPKCTQSHMKQNRHNLHAFIVDFFDDPFFGQAELEPKRLSTKAYSINVRPLPAYNKHVIFSGLVGEFKIQAGLVNADILVGVSITLVISVECSGNIMDALPPEVTTPDAF